MSSTVVSARSGEYFAATAQPLHALAVGDLLAEDLSAEEPQVKPGGVRIVAFQRLAPAHVEAVDLVGTKAAGAILEIAPARHMLEIDVDLLIEHADTDKPVFGSGGRLRLGLVFGMGDGHGEQECQQDEGKESRHGVGHVTAVGAKPRGFIVLGRPKPVRAHEGPSLGRLRANIHSRPVTSGHAHSEAQDPQHWPQGVVGGQADPVGGELATGGIMAAKGIKGLGRVV